MIANLLCIWACFWSSVLNVWMRLKCGHANTTSSVKRGQCTVRNKNSEAVTRCDPALLHVGLVAIPTPPPGRSEAARWPQGKKQEGRAEVTVLFQALAPNSRMSCLCTSDRPSHFLILDPLLNYSFLSDFNCLRSFSCRFGSFIWVLILIYLINVCVQHVGQFWIWLLLPAVMGQLVIHFIRAVWILNDSEDLTLLVQLSEADYI